MIAPLCIKTSFSPYLSSSLIPKKVKGGFLVGLNSLGSLIENEASKKKWRKKEKVNTMAKNDVSKLGREEKN